MLCRQLRGILMVCGIAAGVLAVPAGARACCLFDRWFGCSGSQTTYYSPAYVAPAPCGCGGGCAAPCGTCAQPACGWGGGCGAPFGSCGACAQPACGGCATAYYRAAYYRPAPVVAYMPVTYGVAYSYPCATGCGGCGSCASYAMPAACGGGCYAANPCDSACGISSGVPSSGCSACGVSAESSRTVAPAPAAAPAAAPALGAPSTFVPGPTPAVTPPSSATPAPAPAAPSGAAAPAGGAPSGSGGTTFQGPFIQGVPAVDGGSHANPAPAARSDGVNRTTALPVYRAEQFRLIPSPVQPIPVYPASGFSSRTAGSEPAVVDEGWRPVAGY